MKHIPHEQVQSNTEEQTIDVPVPQIRKETGQVIQLFAHERISGRVVEPTIDIAVRHETNADDKPDVDVQVFKGERAVTQEDNFEGHFHLNDITSAPYGALQIEATNAYNDAHHYRRGCQSCEDHPTGLDVHSHYGANRCHSGTTRRGHESSPRACATAHLSTGAGDVPMIMQVQVPEVQVAQKIISTTHFDSTVTEDNHLQCKFQCDGTSPAPRGASQIEVTVPTHTKFTGRSNQSTIKSPAEFDHVVQEAENHRDKDEVNKTKIKDENGPENHCVTMRSTSIEEKLKSKFEIGHTRETEKAAHARNRSDKNRWGEERELKPNRRDGISLKTRRRELI